MKKDIHPEYKEVVFQDISSDFFVFDEVYNWV